MIPSYEEATAILKTYNKEDFHLQHAKVVSAVMREFAKEYDPENGDYWAVVGLLHDVDFEQYPDEHCVKAREILESHDVDKSIIDSVISHGYGMTGADVEPVQPMEKILFAIDELTGLIGACALVRPSKSIMDMEPKSVMKKY